MSFKLSNPIHVPLPIISFLVTDLSKTLLLRGVVYHLRCGRNSKNLAAPEGPYVVESSIEDTALVLAQLPTSDTVALCTASPL